MCYKGVFIEDMLFFANPNKLGYQFRDLFWQKRSFVNQFLIKTGQNDTRNKDPVFSVTADAYPTITLNSTETPEINEAAARHYAAQIEVLDRVFADVRS